MHFIQYPFFNQNGLEIQRKGKVCKVWIEDQDRSHCIIFSLLFGSGNEDYTVRARKARQKLIGWKNLEWLRITTRCLVKKVFILQTLTCADFVLNFQIFFTTYIKQLRRNSTCLILILQAQIKEIVYLPQKLFLLKLNELIRDYLHFLFESWVWVTILLHSRVI